MPSKPLSLSVKLLLGLCLVSAVLWVRSYWVGHSYGYVTSGAAVYGVSSLRGGVLLSFTPVSAGGRPMGWPSWHISAPVDEFSEPTVRGFAGFGWTGSYYGNTRVLRIPGWFIVALFASMAALLIRHRRRRARAIGLCAKCGYDLRATPERCPECGSVQSTAS